MGHTPRVGNYSAGAARKSGSIAVTPTKATVTARATPPEEGKPYPLVAGPSRRGRALTVPMLTTTSAFAVPGLVTTSAACSTVRATGSLAGRTDPIRA